MVEFSLDLEGAMSSRAISDGKKADRLMYGVFEKVPASNPDGYTLTQVIEKTVIDINGNENLIDGYNLAISLLRGKTYQVVFWAQDADCLSYTVDKAMKVTVDYEGVNNDELRDAFFATQQVTVSSNSSINVTLKRPFAQVNVGAFNSEYDYAKSLGVEVNQSKAIIKGVSNQIDLLTGVASGNVDVEYTFGNIPGETLKGVDSNNDQNAEMYKWVSMSYLLASPVQTTHEMKFYFINSSNPESQIEFNPDKLVPIQRNYRTNLVGQVLSSSFKFKINIDHYYEDERNNPRHVYYVFNESTTIENTEFALNEAAAGNWCVFTTPKGNKDKSIVLTFNDVQFSGGLYGVMFGEDWREFNPATNKLEGVTSYCSSIINNVTAHNVKVFNCVTNYSNHMSILFYLRGNTIVNNCVWDGTTTVNNIPINPCTGDYDGDPVDDNVAYDCGVPNGCVSKIDQSSIGSMYVWEQGEVNITNSNIGYIRNAAIKIDGKQWGLVIGEGTTVELLDSSAPGSYTPHIKIKNGATVKKLNMNGQKMSGLVIEPGASVNGKVFAADMNIEDLFVE